MSEEITQEEYFAEMKMMFRSRGWELFTKELWDNANNINNIQDIKDVDDLWRRRGQLDTIGTILNFEDTILRAEQEADESPE
jgi:hypothetical protein